MTCSSGTKAAVRYRDEPRNDLRHLHAREPARRRRRVADDDCQVQRQVGDVGEGMRRVDGERREHGKDALLEGLPQVLVVLALQLLPVDELDTLSGERRPELLREELVLVAP